MLNVSRRFAHRIFPYEFAQTPFNLQLHQRLSKVDRVPSHRRIQQMMKDSLSTNAVFEKFSINSFRWSNILSDIVNRHTCRNWVEENHNWFKKKNISLMSISWLVLIVIMCTALIYSPTSLWKLKTIWRCSETLFCPLTSPSLAND